jgi:hypothetical protein
MIATIEAQMNSIERVAQKIAIGILATSYFPN